MPGEERVTVSVQAGVADVRLNRPEKMNALDLGMFRALVEAGEAIKSDRSVRAVVLSGEGRAFCAGLDFSLFQAMGEAEPAGQRGDEPGDTAHLGPIGRTEGRITHLGQQVAWVWQEIPVPVVAALHGAVLGGGIQIALGADIRIVAPDVQMSVLEIRWGLTPDMTGTFLLPRLVGPDVAKELTFTGRTVGAEEAVRIGLATRVAEDAHGEALVLAADIAGRSPDAIRGAKALINRAAGLDRSAPSTAGEQFAEERRVIGTLIGSANQAEAVQAYFERREPSFAD